jgi:hypothetical protein
MNGSTVSDAKKIGFDRAQSIRPTDFAHLAEFGIVASVGRNGVEQLLDVIADASDRRLPELHAPVCSLSDRSGSISAELTEAARPFMSAIPPIATQSVRRNETSRCGQ